MGDDKAAPIMQEGNDTTDVDDSAADDEQDKDADIGTKEQGGRSSPDDDGDDGGEKEQGGRSSPESTVSFRKAKNATETHDLGKVEEKREELMDEQKQESQGCSKKNGIRPHASVPRPTGLVQDCEELWRNHDMLADMRPSCGGTKTALVPRVGDPIDGAGCGEVSGGCKALTGLPSTKQEDAGLRPGLRPGSGGLRPESEGLRPGSGNTATVSSFVFADSTNSACKYFPTPGKRVSEEEELAGEKRQGAVRVSGSSGLSKCVNNCCTTSVRRPIPRREVFWDQGNQDLLLPLLEDQSVTGTTKEKATPDERYLVSGARIRFIVSSSESELKKFDEMGFQDQLQFAQQRKTGIGSKIQDGAPDPFQEIGLDPWKGKCPRHEVP